MSYNPTNWVNGETPINDSNLNHIEQGIKDVADLSDAQEIKIADIANNQIPEEYLQSSVDNYIANNQAGLATKTDVNNLDNKLSSEIVDLVQGYNGYKIDVSIDGQFSSSNLRSAFTIRFPLITCSNFKIIAEVKNSVNVNAIQLVGGSATSDMVTVGDSITVELTNGFVNRGNVSLALIANEYRGGSISFKKFRVFADNEEIMLNSIDTTLGIGSGSLEYEYENVSPMCTQKYVDDRVEISRLKGKTILILGDSISDSRLGVEHKYFDEIADRVGCIIENYAVSASGYGIDSVYQSSVDIWGTENNIYNQITKAISDGVKPDYIIIAGGTNDWDLNQNNTPLGSVEDIETEPSTPTIYSEVNAVMKRICMNYFSARVLVITPLPRYQINDSGVLKTQHTKNGRGFSLGDVRKAIIDCSEYYSLPILDMYARSNIHLPNNDTITHYLPDGLHPSKEYHETIFADSVLNALMAI